MSCSHYWLHNITILHFSLSSSLFACTEEKSPQVSRNMKVRRKRERSWKRRKKNTKLFHVAFCCIEISWKSLGSGSLDRRHKQLCRWESTTVHRLQPSHISTLLALAISHRFRSRSASAIIHPMPVHWLRLTCYDIPNMWVENWNEIISRKQLLLKIYWMQYLNCGNVKINYLLSSLVSKTIAKMWARCYNCSHYMSFLLRKLYLSSRQLGRVVVAN